MTDDLRETFARAHQADTEAAGTKVGGAAGGGGGGGCLAGPIPMTTQTVE